MYIPKMEAQQRVRADRFEVACVPLTVPMRRLIAATAPFVVVPQPHVLVDDCLGKLQMLFYWHHRFLAYLVFFTLLLRFGILVGTRLILGKNDRAANAASGLERTLRHELVAASFVLALARLRLGGWLHWLG